MNDFSEYLNYSDETDKAKQLKIMNKIVLDEDTKEKIKAITKKIPFLFLPSLEEDIFSASQGKFREDVKKEQEYIKNADNIILIFPIYSSSMPALIKGYIDRVFSQNFAYSYNNDGSINKLMTGKTISTFSPMGASLEYYEKSGIKSAMDSVFSGTFLFRGFEVRGIHYFGSDNREKMLSDIENLV